MENKMKCPFNHGQNPGTDTVHGANTEIKDAIMSWWPEAINLDILAQHDRKTNPNDCDFNYREEFKNWT